jgi:hypothetical protein
VVDLPEQRLLFRQRGRSSRGPFQSVILSKDRDEVIRGL